MIRVVRGVSGQLGRIARTGQRTTGVPGPIFAGNIPPLVITGEQPFPSVGQILDKVGRTSGWTFGSVMQTCADYFVAGRLLRCQDGVIRTYSAAGDSGAPVFRWNGANGATLAGLLWGSSSLNGTSIYLMSSMRNIALDHGHMNTF